MEGRIEVELSSLKKRKVFTDVIPVRFKWIFVGKNNENNGVV
jgi:hypothetical protein